MKEKNKKRSWKQIVSILSCIVVFCTTYALILPAVTLSTDTFCGKEAHTHDAECYREHDKSKPLCGLEEGEGSEGHTHTEDCYGNVEVGRNLICGMEEVEGHVHDDSCYQSEFEYGLICGKEESEPTEGHVHNEDCYQSETPICGKEEHEHSRECYSNKEDVEDPKDWEEAYKDINKEEDAKTRILTVAKNEVGYKENEANFTVDENDAEHYYTRYGHLYEDMYGDWNNYFTGYVLKYANVKMNFDTDINKWISKTSNDQTKDWEKAEEGNVVFFKGEDDKRKTAIVTTIDLDNKKVKAIQGDVDGAVKEVEIAEDKVLGFLSDEVTLDDLDTPLAGGFEEVDTYSYKDENLSLVIDVEKGSLPKEAKLNVQKIEPETDEYIQAKETLEAEDEILAVNFDFEDEGEPIEVEQDMKVDLDIYNVENPEEEVQIAALDSEEDGTLSKKVVADPEKENITVKDSTLKSNFLLEGGVSMLAMAQKPGGGTSTYEETLNPANPAIKIEKRFYGLSDPINQLGEFNIAINEKKYNLRPNAEDNLLGAKEWGEEANYKYWRWIINDLHVGTYTLSEENADLEGWKRETTGLDKLINTEQTDIQVSSDEIKSNSEKSEFVSLDNGGFFAASLSQGSQVCVVISGRNTTQNERSKIINELTTNKAYTGTWSNFGPSQFRFYYIPEAHYYDSNYVFNIKDNNKDVQIIWNGDTKEISMTKSQDFNKRAGGKLTSKDANYLVENKYTRNQFTLEIKKVSENELNSDNPSGLVGAEFALYEGATLVEEVTTGNDGTIVFKNQLKEETVYWLKETKAPNGYNILENSIYFKVKDNTFTFTDEGGNELENKLKDSNEKVYAIGSIDTSGGSITLHLKIGNTPGQALPNTGGVGTKLFTFSGAAVIAASGLMYGYKKKKDKRNGKGGLRK